MKGPADTVLSHEEIKILLEKADELFRRRSYAAGDQRIAASPRNRFLDVHIWETEQQGRRHLRFVVFDADLHILRFTHHEGRNPEVLITEGGCRISELLSRDWMTGEKDEDHVLSEAIA